MGAGKSTVGKLLADRLDWDFVDMDTLIEEQSDLSIKEIFRRYGEPAFRRLESSVAYRTTKMNHVVIATGGGAPCFHDNIDLFTTHGLAIYIQLSPVVIIERLSKEREERPLVKDLSEDELSEHIHSHLQEREEFYRQAQLITDGNKSIEEIISELIASPEIRTIIKTA